ncbi:hypothetical protein BSKO_11985 [Bryopsis sp. KO-2023]|nr:hypothetical protein BSKO_11985 [Bryopsis sp. KO-2023]
MNRFLTITALFASAAFDGSFARPFAEGTCKITPSAPAGPFIQTAGVLEKGTTLCSEEYRKSGEAAPDAEKVKLSGFVLDEDCKTPVTPSEREVRLLVWQADPNGVYDDFRDQASHYCRGWMTVMEDGSFEVNTLVPGYYQTRPRHFHILIEAEGYETLVTQLYFRDDMRLNKDGNNCCNEELEELWIKKEEGKGDSLRVKYNFYLKRSEQWVP